MIRTKSYRTLALAGCISAGKLNHCYRGLLAVLALCVSTAAWSQTAPTFSGRRVPPNVSSGIYEATPAAATSASAQYRFITIETPNATSCGGNYYCNAAFGINDARLVTGEYTDSSNNLHGFAWQDGLLQTVDYPGSTETGLDVANNRGVVAGDYTDGVDDTWYAATYSFRGGTWTILPNIPNYSNNEAFAINDSGLVVGEAFGVNIAESWMWDPSSQSYSPIVVPGSAQNSTGVDALNDKGQVVGWYTDSSGMTHGFLKEGETYTTIDPPDSTYTLANSINNSGTIVGAWLGPYGWWGGFVRTSDGVFTVLDVPGALETQIWGINDWGDICGVAVNPITGEWTPFVAFKR
jgi:probable HAF family extracellular repeat protein